jgi:hypothetical protein
MVAKKKRQARKLEVPFIPMPPLEVAIVAAQAQAEGKNIDGMCAAVLEAVEENPAIAESAPFSGSQPPSEPPVAATASDADDEEARKREYFSHRYLDAYLRLCIGRIDGLSLEDKDDIAQVATVPGVSFETWLKKKGFAD